jgi:hypothetical protein
MRRGLLTAVIAAVTLMCGVAVSAIAQVQIDISSDVAKQATGTTYLSDLAVHDTAFFYRKRWWPVCSQLGSTQLLSYPNIRRLWLNSPCGGTAGKESQGDLCRCSTSTAQSERRCGREEHAIDSGVQSISTGANLRYFRGWLFRNRKL